MEVKIILDHSCAPCIQALRSDFHTLLKQLTISTAVGLEKVGQQQDAFGSKAALLFLFGSKWQPCQTFTWLHCLYLQLRRELKDSGNAAAK